jgi:hypothetical protein
VESRGPEKSARRGKTRWQGGCGKENPLPVDWSSETWCFAQSELFRSKPVRSDARRVFAFMAAIEHA